jgi:hypothetical protein
MWCGGAFVKQHHQDKKAGKEQDESNTKTGKGSVRTHGGAKKKQATAFAYLMDRSP